MITPFLKSMRHHIEYATFLLVQNVLHGPLCASVHVSTKHCHRLEAIVRQRHAPQSLVMRARIILMAGAGAGVRELDGWGTGH